MRYGKLPRAVIVGIRPESDLSYDVTRIAGNPRTTQDWRYTVQVGPDGPIEGPFTEMEAGERLMQVGYAASSLQSRFSAARMLARDPENKRGARRPEIGNNFRARPRHVKVPGFVACMLHRNIHRVLPGDTAGSGCEKHHRTLMAMCYGDDYLLTGNDGDTDEGATDE